MFSLNLISYMVSMILLSILFAVIGYYLGVWAVLTGAIAVLCFGKFWWKE